MEMILLQKVDNLGDLGEKVNVKSGFGRNFLIPSGKAVPATEDNVKIFEERRAELEKEARLAVEVLPPYIIDEEQSGRVIDARTHFAKKRYEHEFKWTPTPEIQAAIVSEIFNKEPA